MTRYMDPDDIDSLEDLDPIEDLDAFDAVDTLEDLDRTETDPGVDPLTLEWTPEASLAYLTGIRDLFMEGWKDVRALGFPVVFETSEQKAEFLKKTGYPYFKDILLSHQDIDGVWLSNILGHPLKSAPLTTTPEMDDLLMESEYEKVDTLDDLPDIDDGQTDDVEELEDDDVDPEKKAEMAALLAQYSSTYWQDLHDAFFWFTVFFDNVEAKAEFMEKFNLAVDDFGCIEGRKFASAVGINDLSDGTYRVKLVKPSKAIRALIKERR